MMFPEDIRQRALVMAAIRSFFQDRGYCETDTPIRLPAPIPEAYIEPIKSGDWYLQTSPEIFMKRLLSAGCDRLFQICHCFRNNERGKRHLPEFTMLEWYRTGADYCDLMDECEELIHAVAAKLLLPDGVIRANGKVVRLDLPWQRLTVAEAFRRHAPMGAEKAVAADLFDETLVTHVEPHLGSETPVFLHDYPAALASLARLRQDQPEVAERFELYIGGIELANGFSELIDAAEQRRRFVAENEKITVMGRNPAPIPERFLRDLSGMPPAAGIALGVDRLVMLLLGKQTIDEAVTFSPDDY